MNQERSSQKLVFLTLAAALTTVLTVVLGAPFLRVLRKVYGAKTYWLLGAFLGAFFWVLGAFVPAIYLTTVWMTLGVYVELESRGQEWLKSGAMSLALGTLVSVTGVLLLSMKMGLHSLVEVKEAAHKFLMTVQTLNPEAKVDATALIQLAPSSALVLLIFALTFGVIFERRAYRWFQFFREKSVTEVKFLGFRNPDALVWISLSAFLVTLLVDKESLYSIVSENIFRVCLALYFLQGLAVVEVFFVSLRVSLVTRILGYLLLVGPIVSILGFIDYWVDFRRRVFTLKFFSKSS